MSTTPPGGAASQETEQPQIVGLLLAAGSGSRFGMPKALARYRGELLIERAHRMLTDAGLPTVVVLGAAADQVRQQASLPGAVICENPDHATGMGSSLRHGLTAIPTAYPQCCAALVMLVDMPWLSAAAVSRLRQIAVHGGPQGAAGVPTRQVLLQASYDGVAGHPVVLGRDHHEGVIAAASGDSGARQYLRSHSASLHLVPCEDVASGADADTPQQLESTEGGQGNVQARRWG